MMINHKLFLSPSFRETKSKSGPRPASPVLVDLPGSPGDLHLYMLRSKVLWKHILLVIHTSIISKYIYIYIALDIDSNLCNTMFCCFGSFPGLSPRFSNQNKKVTGQPFGARHRVHLLRRCRTPADRAAWQHRIFFDHEKCDNVGGMKGSSEIGGIGCTKNRWDILTFWHRSQHENWSKHVFLADSMGYEWGTKQQGGETWQRGILPRTRRVNMKNSQDPTHTLGQHCFPVDVQIHWTKLIKHKY